MIRTKLTIVVLVLSIVPLLLSTLFLTNYFNGVTKSDNHQMMQNTADQNIGRIDEWIRLKISAMEELIKSHPKFQGGKPEQLLPLLRTIDESDKQINGFNLIDTKGNAVDTQNVKISVADRAYFKKVQETKKPAISDLLVSKKTGKYVLPLAAPILDSAGNLTGVISATVSPETLTTLTTGIKIGNTGSGFIISGKGDYYAHPEFARIGTKVGDFEKSQSAQNAFKQMNETANGTVTYTDGGGRDVVSYYATITGTSWKLVVTAPTSEVYDAVNKAQMFAFLSVAVFLVLVIIISVLLAKFIVKPVLSISDTMKKVAEGDLTERVKIGSQDEIGDMSRNINAMIESLAGIVQKINLAINQVSAASEELLDSAEQSSKAAAHIASSIQEVASGADTQLQGAEQSATAMEEMATRTGTGKSNRPSDR